MSSAVKTFQLTVNPDAPVPVSIITASPLGAAHINVPYNRTLQATGGVAPYVWSVVGGALPAGLSLDPSTGVVSGTPSVSGDFSFDVQVSDAG